MCCGDKKAVVRRWARKKKISARNTPSYSYKKQSFDDANSECATAIER